MASLQQEVSSHDTHTTAFSSQLATLQSQLDQSQAELADSQQQLSHLNSEMASSQAQHAKQAERARQEQQAVSQQAKAADVQVQALQGRLDQATQLAASSGRDLAAAKVQVRRSLTYCCGFPCCSCCSGLATTLPILIAAGLLSLSSVMVLSVVPSILQAYTACFGSYKLSGAVASSHVKHKQCHQKEGCGSRWLMQKGTPAGFVMSLALPL